MSIGTETEWKEGYADLKKVSDNTWIDPFTDYIHDFISEMELTTISPPSGGEITITFDKAIFKEQLAKSDPKVLFSGTLALSLAYSLMSNAVVVVIPSGSYIGTETLATTFSATAVAAVDSLSVTTAATTIVNLKNIPEKEFTSDPLKSKFPVVLRDAFLAIKIVVTGSNSVNPPAPIGVPLESVQ